jgi:MerR family transcriptional regulator, light-induced transcriptional regulator
VKGLAISDVAERTGLAAGTIRMWEQRYGFPTPGRAPSGYRVYRQEDVDLLRRAVAFRARGLSVPAALDRARTLGETDRPSIYGAIVSGEVPARSHVLRKRTLTALSHAIEDETMARAAGPVIFGAFQHVHNYRREQHRYHRLSEGADAAVVFADFPEPRVPDHGPAEVPIAPDAALGNEWAVIVDAPGYAACLLAWERPRSPEELRLPDRERRFESLGTMDPAVVRRAALVGCALTRASCPDLAERIERTLADRPLAVESPAPALTALTNRMVGYLEADRG